MREDVGERGRGLQHVVHRTEQDGVRHEVERRLRDGGGEQVHVAPALLADPSSRHLEHLRGGVDPDDGPRGTDLALQRRQA
jgi:hypothetical protein